MYKKEAQIQKYFKKAKKKFDNYLEIYNYIHTVQDVDLLKKCLLDRDDQILFNFL